MFWFLIHLESTSGDCVSVILDYPWQCMGMPIPCSVGEDHLAEVMQPRLQNQVAGWRMYLDVRRGKSFLPVVVTGLEGSESGWVGSRFSCCIVRGFSEEGRRTITRSQFESWREMSSMTLWCVNGDEQKESEPSPCIVQRTWVSNPWYQVNSQLTEGEVEAFITLWRKTENYFLYAGRYQKHQLNISSTSARGGR